MAERVSKAEPKPTVPQLDTTQLAAREPTAATRDMASLDAALDPADLLDSPVRTSRGGEDETRAPLNSVVDADPGAMYADPAAAYEGFVTAVADAEEAVDQVEDEYYDALREVETVARDYQDAIESGDPVALEIARARLDQLQNDTDRLRDDLDDAESALTEAIGDRNAFEADHPDLVEEVTGLTPDQHRDLDERHDLQDAVSQAEAELAALDDPAFDQLHAAQESQWTQERDSAESAVTGSEAQVDVAAGGVMAQLHSVLAQVPASAFQDPLSANAALGLTASAILDPDSLAQLEADLADPDTDPQVALATFLDGAALLPADHPSMIALNQRFDALAAARTDLAEAEARLDTAEQALASLDAVGDEHDARRDELQQELSEAEQALAEFEQTHPDLDEIDTDELDAAEREAEAVEDARLSHLENTLDDLVRLDQQIEDGDGALAANAGLSTFVSAQASATDTLDDAFQAAEQEVEIAEAEQAEGATDGPPPPVQLVVSQPTETALFDTDFGGGRAAAPDDRDEDDPDPVSRDLFEPEDPFALDPQRPLAVDEPDLIPEPAESDDRSLTDDDLVGHEPDLDFDP